jgi:hypothetical protein
MEFAAVWYAVSAFDAPASNPVIVVWRVIAGVVVGFATVPAKPFAPATETLDTVALEAWPGTTKIVPFETTAPESVVYWMVPEGCEPAAFNWARVKVAGAAPAKLEFDAPGAPTPAPGTASPWVTSRSYSLAPLVKLQIGARSCKLFGLFEPPLASGTM